MLTEKKPNSVLKPKEMYLDHQKFYSMEFRKKVFKKMKPTKTHLKTKVNPSKQQQSKMLL